MSHKTKQILLIALLSLLITALFAASFTYARYYKETGVTGGKYDDTIEFVGANKYIVYSPEELVSAIENGYSYIEIAEDVEDPFIITDGVTDVSANLVLDINGHNLVRNSRNPLIDVQENVSVVIVYDSKASGSFYNPVGSMLQASGGTLTIATGNFTSGPKVEDYVTDVGTPKTVTVYSRSGRGATAYDETENVSMPAPSDNMYFADGTFANGESNKFIKDDTFLIYTEETVDASEGTTVDFEPLCDVASCDFYYYYEKSTEGTGDEQTTTYAVIYGYHDVMAGAKKQITAEGFNESEDAIIDPATAVIWPYAAVRMTEGEAFIRGGTYTNQFGTAQSYGIYARGGSLSVQGANTSFTSVADGVCIRCTKEGDAAPSLHIENGSFTSYNGDTVRVNGGTMTVNSGTFTKSGDSTDNSTKTAIIHMTGGALTAAGSADASGKKSIQMTCAASAGTLSNVFGVYSEGGTVSLQNAEISVNGTDSACVLAEQAGSKVDLQSVSINLSGAQSDGKITSAAVNTLGGSITLSGSNQITSDGFGITAAADVSITGGETAVGSEEATLPTTAIYVFGGSLSVSTGATLSVHAEIDENLKWAGYEESTNAYQYDGVQVNGGSLLVYGALNVAFTGLENDNSGDYSSQQIKSYAVRVEAASGGETKVIIASGNITNSVGGGIYVGGGEVTLGDSENNSGPNVKTEGKLLYASVTNPDWSWQQPTYEWKYVVNNSWKYMLNRSGGHAVEVSGGSLTVHGGSYSAQQGNGILIRNTSGSQISNQVTINSGSFTGYNGGYYISYDNNYGYSGTPLGGDRMVGPAASYGLNVMGHDLNVTINGGSFGETGETGNSAASFFGTSGGVKADVNVYGGTFNATNADAISIFRYIDIMFDGTAISSNIGGTADVASLSVQDDLLYTNDPYRGSTITLNNGTFTGTAYGVWYACGYDQLNISGNATINGKVGVQVASAPKTEKGIYISGGTIEGSTDGIYYNAGYGASASIGDEGYGLNITGGTIRGTAKGNGHALNIAVQPRRHAISISGGELYGGRDTVYVSNADGDEDAVSISGGTFTGAVADVEGSRDYGCAVWFNSGMNNSI